MAGDLRLRRVDERDRDRLFIWANDPVARSASFKSEPIAWEEHVAWFGRRAGRDDCLDLILSDDSQDLGVIRFDIKGRNATASITVDSAHRGCGYGRQLVSMGVSELFEVTDVERVYAYVRAGNDASARTFEAAGFSRDSDLVVSGVPAARMVMERRQMPDAREGDGPR